MRKEFRCLSLLHTCITQDSLPLTFSLCLLHAFGLMIFKLLLMVLLKEPMHHAILFDESNTDSVFKIEKGLILYRLVC